MCRDFKDGKMTTGLTVSEKRMKALDPNQNEVYKFLGYQQVDKIEVKR